MENARISQNTHGEKEMRVSFLDNLKVVLTTTRVCVQGVSSMKLYVPVVSAAVLIIIALGLIVTGVSNVAGLPVLGMGSHAYGYLAAGSFSGGVFSTGFFSAGVFACGVFAVGVFSIGIFSVGIFSIGIFNVGIYAIGLYAIGKYANKLVSSRKEGTR
jgi:hypothetical protein